MKCERILLFYKHHFSDKTLPVGDESIRVDSSREPIGIPLHGMPTGVYLFREYGGNFPSQRVEYIERHECVFGQFEGNCRRRIKWVRVILGDQVSRRRRGILLPSQADTNIPVFYGIATTTSLRVFATRRSFRYVRSSNLAWLKRSGAIPLSAITLQERIHLHLDIDRQ